MNEDTQSAAADPSGPGEDVPDRPGGTAAFARALNVERNAKLGFGVGVLVALSLLALVVLNADSSSYPVFLYAGLAFVLATGVGLLLTMVFTVGSLVRRVREMDESDEGST